MINKAFLKRWVAALRSGEYQQCRFFLKKENSFCCLGVACDIYAKETNNNWDDNRMLGNSTCIPDTISSMIGISLYYQTKLMSLNDEKNKNFNEIADVIETDYLVDNT